MRGMLPKCSQILLKSSASEVNKQSLDAMVNLPGILQKSQKAEELTTYRIKTILGEKADGGNAKNMCQKRSAYEERNVEIEKVKYSMGRGVLYRNRENDPKTENGKTNGIPKMGNASRESTNGMGGDAEIPQRGNGKTHPVLGGDGVFSRKIPKKAKPNRLRIFGRLDGSGSLNELGLQNCCQ